MASWLESQGEVSREAVLALGPFGSLSQINRATAAVAL